MVGTLVGDTNANSLVVIEGYAMVAVLDSGLSTVIGRSTVVTLADIIGSEALGAFVIPRGSRVAGTLVGDADAKSSVMVSVRVWPVLC